MQLSPKIADVAANLAAIAQELERAARDQVELLVLPELATCGYSMTPKEARACSLAVEDEVLQGWSELLAGSNTTAVIGFCENAGEVLYNSAAVIVPGAAPVAYRKLHLWDTEKLIFAPGTNEPPVLQTPAGALAVIICYDLEFPEIPRSVALRGAEILAVPTNWPMRTKPEGERPQEIIHAMAAAQASGIIIACCDRAGDERGVSWTEGTSVVDTDGWPSGGPGPDGRLDVEAVLSSRRRQIGERNDLFADRRPEFYQTLVS
ncbi:MAG: carbon-nitrogen hydrolase [Micrococcales bacterium]|nr:carbon-nitrogen hydrolase [Micrococcales bacterium]